MIMASQEHIDRLTDAGREVLRRFLEIVATSYGPEVDVVDRDRAVGRELGMAIFLAARGDEEFSRILLINGLGLAVGECAAQQGSAEAAQGLVDALQKGVTVGVEFANEAFAPAGRA